MTISSCTDFLFLRKRYVQPTACPDWVAKLLRFWLDLIHKICMYLRVIINAGGGDDEDKNSSISIHDQFFSIYLSMHITILQGCMCILGGLHIDSYRCVIVSSKTLQFVFFPHILLKPPNTNQKVMLKVVTRGM